MCEPGNSGPPPSLKYSAFAIFCNCEMLCSFVILLEPARAARSISLIVLLLDGCVAYCRNMCAANGLAAHLGRLFAVPWRRAGAAIERIAGAGDMILIRTVQMREWKRLLLPFLDSQHPSIVIIPPTQSPKSRPRMVNLCG